MSNTSTFIIPNGESLSNGIDLGDSRAARIDMPSGWTAASLTFQTSADGVTWTNLYTSAGVEYSITAAASTSILLTLADFLSIRFLKVRSGAAGAAVNQGAARTLLVGVVTA